MLFYKLFSSLKIMGAIKDLNIKLWAQISQLLGENLIHKFGAIYVRIMPFNFQVSSFTDVGGEWGDRQTHTGRQAFLNRSLYKKLCDSIDSDQTLQLR